MSSKEDKIKIKVAIARLKKKNAFYKDYCKSNKIKIKGRVKEAIDSINLLCKLITKLAARKDFYQKLPEGFEGPCGYVPSAILHIVESAELAWEPAVTKCTDIKNVERDVSMFGCFPWTSESYPWPTYFDKNNKKVYAAPGMQIDLRSFKEFNEDDLGDGLLQVWFTGNFKNNNADIVLIPRSIVNKEKPDVAFHHSKDPWQQILNSDLLSDIELELMESDMAEAGSKDWVINDWKIIGVQTDECDSLPEFSDEWDRVDVDEFDFTYNTSKIINMIYDLLSDRNEYGITSLFGVPAADQRTWKDFYNEGNRNLLTLNSEGYIQLGDEINVQLTYKKENNGVSFSFYWDCD
jgi:hypothetical protein